ncbi:hypothetical protein R2103_04995 [Nitrosomonas sp. Is24]|uniref:hypothetical protein n=1 Tax=Nitrosomonas sp. Is24 TaxID=3080533 RepID=UPI00294AC730|nr:hypothetical protein [Nitrosomonas sp. Is24]MDV6341124.1 hypothetical protein [Nitrosomonas sp. Is24]
MQNATNTSITDLNQWFTLDEFSQAYPKFTRSQIEWLHRHRETNGFAIAFRKIGKRRYVHAGIFAKCLLKED